MDDLKSFTYVLAVAECKSISKVAELLYISQPSLSRFISSLEQELGILLFERKSNGISLTEAGEIYVEYGKEIKRFGVEVAKNYLNEKEIDALNKIVTAYLDIAEVHGLNQEPMYMPVFC